MNFEGFLLVFSVALFAIVIVLVISVSDLTSERNNLMSQGIERGFAQYCSQTGKWAWLDEC
jgi:ABC-type lipoprotein release transport system permease subunit